jgi:two-component system, cell cycle sensor histidine kinase and response regulator CckA
MIEKIDILVTDVIMPHMNGKELYDRFRSEKPGLRALFISGYAEDAIAHHGVLEKNTNFIAKPFTVEAFSKKVRTILDN